MTENQEKNLDSDESNVQEILTDIPATTTDKPIESREYNYKKEYKKWQLMGLSYEKYTEEVSPKRKPWLIKKIIAIIGRIFLGSN